MEYNTLCKFLYLLGSSEQKLIIFSREKKRYQLLSVRFYRKKSSELIDSEKAGSLILKLVFEVLRSNIMFFHEIIQVSTVFSG